MGISNQFTWSKSRAGKLQDCTRKYLLHYYTYWNGWNQASSDEARRVYRLRALNTVPTWQGKVVHHALQTALLQFKDTEKLIPLADLVESACQRINDQWAVSKSRDYRNMGPKDPRFFGLIEHELGQSLDDDTPVVVFARAANALTNVYASSLWKHDILESDPKKWLNIDELAFFRLHGTKIWAVPDLLFTDTAGLTRIIDWKTGAPDPESERFQMLSYAAYAHLEHSIPLDKISATLVFTRGHQLETTTLNADLDGLREFAAHAETSMGCMTALLVNEDRKANKPLPLAKFEQTTDTYKCNRCCFRNECYPDGVPDNA